MTYTIGLLHPGSMGSAIGAQLRARGHLVLWCPDGRSETTRRRAESAGLEAEALSELVSRSDVLLSLCPPAAAEEIAAQVELNAAEADTIYVEANAVSPSRVQRIADRLAPMPVIDAAVVGSPPVGGKYPTLYLSGPGKQADGITELFAGTDVRPHVLGDTIGKASALKLAYSSYQKVSRVLAAVAYGAADTYGVADELLEIAARRTRSYLVETDYIPKTAARAWRWGPELEDAAALLADAGLPDSLVRAAAETLTRWDGSRGERLDITEALEALRLEGDVHNPS
ncbi:MULTISPECIES: NAD(P)-dependent oxidoreductase [unclassified Streptomyces]|uniref:NAD(P)-dependent oxidoreductase n=1 Tax=unclassified Streptomyces TaxID=2593676 RepID=UPI0024759537|nr:MULTISPECIES: NAD(P)-dependent oxidoreductase [unclassified Streptomyces]MDH6451714.1 3-hydroxyisobutyrate dehydrogenase-like beta-hydroxyacid dehydrogenase [Streptomyces sp. SAI-119]MDH6497729.1 3-hydroxyisobutyrate dehydrogenase-like beta-hydroxyacid dehydrogenase [Streptomyces sp. SAI-149]